jgi:Leucine-rich repeat (LRR) protein
METEIKLLIENLQSNDDSLVQKAINVILQANITEPKLLPSLEKLLTFDLYTDTDDNGSGGMPYTIYLDYNYAPQAIAQIIKNKSFQNTYLTHFWGLVAADLAHPIVVGKIFVDVGSQTLPLLKNALNRRNPQVRRVGLYGLAELRAIGVAEFAKNALLDLDNQELAFRGLTRLTLPIPLDTPAESLELITWQQISVWVESAKNVIAKPDYNRYLEIIKSEKPFLEKWIHEQQIPSWYDNKFFVPKTIKSELLPNIFPLPCPEDLATLDLTYKKLGDLPSEIEEFTGIKELNLRGNQLSALPPEIKNLTQLEHLNARGNTIEKLPPEIGKLIHLKSISLMSNCLTALPKEIANLKNLNDLLLNSNRFEVFPVEICALADLKRLHLSHNLIAYLPTEIKQLINLDILDIGYNQLTTLPVEIGSLKKLRNLHVLNNQLTFLLAEIGELINLQLLHLSVNQLTTLPAAIGKLVNLKFLELSYNQFKSLPIEITNFMRLEELSLQKNQLTTLPSDIKHLANLKKLDLSQNQISFLPPEIGFLTHLIDLDLGYNQLTSLPSEISNLINLKKLNLRKHLFSQEIQKNIKAWLPNCEINFG